MSGCYQTPTENKESRQNSRTVWCWTRSWLKSNLSLNFRSQKGKLRDFLWTCLYIYMWIRKKKKKKLHATLSECQRVTVFKMSIFWLTLPQALRFLLLATKCCSLSSDFQIFSFLQKPSYFRWFFFFSFPRISQTAKPDRNNNLKVVRFWLALQSICVCSAVTAVCILTYWF